MRSEIVLSFVDKFKYIGYNNIKDIFAKSIDRDLKGVIKVGQAEDENIKQELEEYVVTKELQKHFATFFDHYKKGINGRTDKMGVWISGFFGSGKSHFLKIISYILENKTVDGIPAIEYFERDTPTSGSDIRAIFRDNGQQLTLGGTSTEINKLALNEVGDYIARNSLRHVKTSMKTLMDRFMAPPYGFIEADVQWLVAKLFKDGEIAFYVNNEMVSLISKSADELYRYVTRKEFLEKLMTEKRVKANEKQKKAVRAVMKDFLTYSCPSDDDDTIMSDFMKRAANLKNDLEKLEIMYNNQPAYPCRKIIVDGKKLLIDVLDFKYPTEFFALVDSTQDDFLDFAEDYEPIKKFFAGEQKGIWDTSLKLMKIYDESKTYIVDADVEAAVKAIKAILQKSSPFSDIYKLPDLNDKFRKAYMQLVKAEQAPVLDTINEARKRVFDELNASHSKDKFYNRVIRNFDDLSEKATHCNNVATLKNIRHEADALKVRLLNEIGTEEDRYLAAEAAKQAAETTATEAPAAPAPKQKKHKTVSVKTLTSQATWRIENDEDIRTYITELEKKLRDELEDNTIINVEF